MRLAGVSGHDRALTSLDQTARADYEQRVARHARSTTPAPPRDQRGLIARAALTR